MIHLANAPIDFATVMGPVWLPIKTFGAPDRSTIFLTNINIPLVKIVQAWCGFRSCKGRKGPVVGVSIQASVAIIFPILPTYFLSRDKPVYLSMTLSVPPFCLHLVLLLGIPLGSIWDVPWIDRDCKQKTKVGGGDEEQEKGVQH